MSRRLPFLQALFLAAAVCLLPVCLPAQTAAKGNGAALFERYLAYFFGRGVPQDYKKALECLQQGVAAGDARSECELAYRYESDYATNFLEFKDDGARLRQTFHLYSLASAQDLATAQFRLAKFYLSGTCVEQDEAMGVELTRKSADRDIPEALSALDGLYSHGIGEPRNADDSPFQLMCRAAVLEVKKDRYLAWGYYAEVIKRCEIGVGTDRDLTAAAQWYARGSVAGIVYYFGRPMFPLTGMLEASLPAKVKTDNTGTDVTLPITPELRAALAVYLRAAVQKDAQAALELGNNYLSGIETPRNSAKAWPWLKLAAQHGATAAAEKVVLAESSMSEAELQRVQDQLPVFLDELKKVAAAVHSEKPVTH